MADEAIYKCIASNKVGQSYRDISVTVLVPPELDTVGFPDHVEVILSRLCGFSLTVVGLEKSVVDVRP